MSIKNLIKSALFYFKPINKTIANVQVLQPNEYLKGRTALITGGTSGIGYEIAKAFINAGATVIITGRDVQKLSSAANALGG